IERHAPLKRSYVSWVNAQSFPGLQVAHHQFAREFQPRRSLTAQLLQKESIAAEDARSQRLLKRNRYLNLGRSAKETMAMDHVFVPGPNLDRHNVSGQLGGEGNFARNSDRAVFGHENRAATNRSLEYAEETSAAAELR